MTTEPETWNEDEVFAAMCIMDEIADPHMPDAARPWQEVREMHGINELRRVIGERLAKPCNAAWDRAWKRFEAGNDNPHRDDCQITNIDPTTCTCGANPDPGSFDVDFVPVWLRECVDWSDPRDGPRVRGSHATA